MKMPNKLEYKQDDFEPFQLDEITSIVIHSQKNRNNIEREWNKYLQFVNENKDFDYVDEFGKSIDGNVSKLRLKEEYIVDSIYKIYFQIKRTPMIILKSRPIIDIFFYSYSPHLKENWAAENVLKGEFDSENRLNTGAYVEIRILSIDWLTFVSNYKEAYN